MKANLSSDQYLTKASKIINNLESKIQKYMTAEFDQLIDSENRQANIDQPFKESLQAINKAHLSVAKENWERCRQAQRSDFDTTQKHLIESQGLQSWGSEQIHSNVLEEDSLPQGCQVRLRSMLKQFHDQQANSQFYSSLEYKHLKPIDSTQGIRSPEQKNRGHGSALQEDDVYSRLSKDLLQMQKKIQNLQSKMTCSRSKKPSKTVKSQIKKGPKNTSERASRSTKTKLVQVKSENCLGKGKDTNELIELDSRCSLRIRKQKVSSCFKSVNKSRVNSSANKSEQNKQLFSFCKSPLEKQVSPLKKYGSKHQKQPALKKIGLCKLKTKTKGKVKEDNLPQIDDHHQR